MRIIRWILFIAFCFIILWITLFSRTPNGKHTIILGLFWSYRLLLSGESDSRRVVIQNIQNVLFFIPFGAFIPSIKWKNVLIAAFSLSFSVEVLQYIFCLGYAEIDDVICNTVGAMIGFGIIKLGIGIITKFGEKRSSYEAINSLSDL